MSGRWRSLAWIVGLGVAYRLAYVFDLAGKIDGDNAVVALMAKHILEGRHYAFFWGQSYMGSLEAYSIATAARAFGLNDLVLRGVPLAYALLYMASFHALGRRLGGEALGRVSLVLAALCPPLLAAWSSAPRGGYAEMLFLGQLALLLALSIVQEKREDRKQVLLVALGFVAGLAFWTNLVSLGFLLTAATILFCCDRRLFVRPAAVLGVAAFVLGSLPLWLHNLRHGFDTFTLLTSSRSGASPLAAARSLLVAHGPKILGIRDLVGEQAILLPPLGWLIGGVIVFGLGWEIAARVRDLWRFLRGLREEPGLEVCIVLLTIVLALYLPSRYATWNTQRYLLPLYSALIPLLAASWLRCRERFPAAAGLVALAAFVVLARGAWTAHQEFSGPMRAPGSLPEVVQFLETRGIRHGYADHSEALVNTYRSGERVILVDWAIGRYPVREIADWRPNALLVRGGGEALAASLGELHCRHGTERFRTHTLFYDFHPETPEGTSLPHDARWRVEASDSAAEARLAIDGDPMTRWASHRPQRPGMSFELDLGEIREIVGLRLHSGAFRHDTPRGLRIEGAEEGGAWRTLAEISHPFPGLAIRNGAARLEPHATVESRFPPATVRKLRLIQTGSDPALDWSITEIEILGPSGK